jgi:hypothetical protein
LNSYTFKLVSGLLESAERYKSLCPFVPFPLLTKRLVRPERWVMRRHNDNVVGVGVAQHLEHAEGLERVLCVPREPGCDAFIEVLEGVVRVGREDVD